MNLQSSHGWLSIHVAPISLTDKTKISLTCEKCFTRMNTKPSKIREEIPGSNTNRIMRFRSRDRKFVRVMKCIFWQEEEALIDNEGSGDRDPSTPVPRLPLFRQRWFSGRNYPVEGDEDWQGRSCGWQAGRGDNPWGLDNYFGKTVPPSRFAGAPEFWLLPSQRLVCV